MNRLQAFAALLVGTAALMPAASAHPACTNSDRCRAEDLRAGLDIPDALISHVDAQVITNNPDYCNVTVHYGHPDFNDSITTNIALPLTDWNGRFQGVGGGGWAASSGPESLLPALKSGYIAGNTNAGHGLDSRSTDSWAFTAEGEQNLPLLRDFAYLALAELPQLGNQLSTAFYGAPPRYSYWSGCSTGGRQGLMMAQRYPGLYDGIAAAAPAIYWDRFIVAEFWPQFVMERLGHWPPQCAFEGFNAAAVEACDGVDGVNDGVIAEPGRCGFDPFELVGVRAECENEEYVITEKDASIVQKVWEGPHDPSGRRLWWGLEPGASFSGLTNTSCANGVSNCTGVPFPISTDWISNWVLSDPDSSFSSLTWASYSDLFSSAYEQYSAIIGTDDTDLSAFKAAGGKMITWHGLADQLIFPKGTQRYYEDVESNDPAVRDFYRFFEAPGVGHCDGGAGEVPGDPLRAVVKWVEEGIAPDTLPATSEDGRRTRDLCPYPLVSVFQGGDPTDAGSFICGTRDV